jgi:hypothetical protein
MLKAIFCTVRFIIFIFAGHKDIALQFSLCFMKPSAVWPFGSPDSFESPGAGVSLGFVDPSAGIGYASDTNQMGTRLTGDPRDLAMREALYSALSASTEVPVRQ